MYLPLKIFGAVCISAVAAVLVPVFCALVCLSTILVIGFGLRILTWLICGS
jgi:hypothetical protein